MTIYLHPLTDPGEGRPPDAPRERLSLWLVRWGLILAVGWLASELGRVSDEATRLRRELAEVRAGVVAVAKGGGR